jgi:Tol biopolymer transport system component
MFALLLLFACPLTVTAALLRGHDLPDSTVLSYYHGGQGVRFLDMARGLSPPALIVREWTQEAPNMRAFWSPDSQWMVFRENYTNLVIADGYGKRITTLPEQFQGAGFEPVWKPDSSGFAFTGSRGSVDNIVFYDIATGELREITQFDGALEYSPLWSPDGSLLMYTLMTGYTDESGVYVISPDGGQPRPIYEGRAQYHYQPAWSPDGRYIALTAINDVNERDLLVFDLITGELTHPPDSRALNNQRPAWSGDYLAWIGHVFNGGLEIDVIDFVDDDLKASLVTSTTFFDWSPVGGQLVTINAGEMELYDVESDQLRTLTQGFAALTANVNGVAWSPDGSWFAVESWSNGTSDIYRVDVDPAGVRRLTDNGRSLMPVLRP